MSKMIGEQLVESGVITEAHLDKALKAQLVHGGHLGTCLIELGFVGEQQLGETLAEILGVSLADPPMFHSIPDPVIEAIPRHLVEKHRVVPIRLDERTLHVAMINPKDLAAIDELQFATGHAVEAWIAPEVRIVLAMENYYGIPRSRRYVLLSPDPRLIPQRKKKKIAKAKPAASNPAALPQHETPPEVVQIGGDTDGSDPYSFGQPPIWSDLGLENDYAREPLQGLSDHIDRLDDAMCAASNTNELSTSVLDCVSVGVTRSILFRVHRQVARIWDSRGFGNLHDTGDDSGFEVTEEPLFQLISGTGAYLGTIDDLSDDYGFYHDLGIQKPSQVLLLPVYVKDHLIAMLYCDSGPDGEIRGTLPEYQRVANKIAPALELQALERKLRRI